MGAKVSLSMQVDMACICPACRARLLVEIAMSLENQMAPEDGNAGNLCITAAALSCEDRETFDACADIAFELIDVVSSAQAPGSIH